MTTTTTEGQTSMSETETVAGIDMDAEIRQYVATLVWSSTIIIDGEDDEEQDSSTQAQADAYETSEALDSECADAVRAFITANAQDSAEYAARYGVGQVGHDFALTRNGNGAGFWDRGAGILGERLSKAASAEGEHDMYLGSDGTLYGF